MNTKIPNDPDPEFRFIPGVDDVPPPAWWRIGCVAYILAVMMVCMYASWVMMQP